MANAISSKYNVDILTGHFVLRCHAHSFGRLQQSKRPSDREKWLTRIAYQDVQPVYPSRNLFHCIFYGYDVSQIALNEFYSVVILAENYAMALSPGLLRSEILALASRYNVDFPKIVQEGLCNNF
jgi:hypothetical protein